MITKTRITRAMLLSSLVMAGCNMTPSVLHGVSGATPSLATGDDASRCAENIPWIKRLLLNIRSNPKLSLYLKILY